jgi:hypothetical protein
MTTHYLRSTGILAALFGIGQAETLCGSQVPSDNGPVDDPADCSECINVANGGPDRNRPPLI